MDLSDTARFSVRSEQVISSLTLRNCFELKQLDLSGIKGLGSLYIEHCDQLQKIVLPKRTSSLPENGTAIYLWAPNRNFQYSLSIDGACSYISGEFGHHKFNSLTFPKSAIYNGVDIYSVSRHTASNPLGTGLVCDFSSRLAIYLGGAFETGSMSFMPLFLRDHQYVLVQGALSLRNLSLFDVVPDNTFYLSVLNCPSLKRLEYPDLNTDSAMGKVRLKSSANPLLGYISLPRADRVSISKVKMSYIKLEGGIKQLSLASVYLDTLRAEQVNHLAMINTAIDRHELPINSLDVQGVCYTGKGATDRFQGADLMLADWESEFKRQPARTVQRLKLMIAHGQDRQIALFALQVLNRFARLGLPAKELWQLRQCLNLYNVGAAEYWVWRFPYQTYEKGWLLDFNIWLICLRENVDEAKAYLLPMQDTLKKYESAHECYLDTINPSVAILKTLNHTGYSDKKTQTEITLYQTLVTSLSWFRVTKQTKLLDAFLSLAKHVGYLEQPNIYQAYIQTLIELIVHTAHHSFEATSRIIRCLISAFNPNYYDQLRIVPARILMGLNKSEREMAEGFGITPEESNRLQKARLLTISQLPNALLSACKSRAI